MLKKDVVSMSDYDAIKVELEDDIFYLTIDREHRMNSINPGLLEELEEALKEAEEKEARCVVIEGAGENFSAGADVSSFSPKVQDLYKTSRMGKDAFACIERAPMPVIAAIRGNCLGGGLEMSLACDLRIAAEDAKIGQPEINLGIIPGWGGTLRLPKVIGIGKAKELIMLGDRISAEEAEKLGLVNKVVEVNEFEDEVEELAQELANGPPIAMKFAKYCINYGSKVPVDIGKEVESGVFGQLGSTDDMIEGIEAFMEDRDPDFEGK